MKISIPKLTLFFGYGLICLAFLGPVAQFHSEFMGYVWGGLVLTALLFFFGGWFYCSLTGQQE